MKKKAILAASLALALMASPFGGINVSAEEGENVSVQDESRAAAPVEKETLGAPRNVRFSADLGWCTFSFPATYFGPYQAHIWVYRDGELAREYNTLGDNSNPWNFYVRQGEAGGRYYSVQTPFYQDLEDSGSYYFKVRMEKLLPDGLAVSATVTSETVQYIRPDQALETTTGYWDTEKEGLFHYTSVDGAAGYEYRLYKQSGSRWMPCILRSTAGGTYTSIGHLSAFSSINPDSPRDAGGEDRTIDFTNDIFGNPYVDPEGSYCVTIRALSGDLNETANGSEGAMSDALQIGRGSVSDSDPGQEDTDTSSTLESRIETAQSGDVIQMQDVTTLSSSEVKHLLENGLTLEMEYTYEGVDYKVRIPAGASMDESIPWYGPLYLAQHYGVSRLGGTSAAGGPSYTVQKGDTLGKIARANNMSLAELTAKNPQIKNADVLIPGQTIQIK